VWVLTSTSGKWPMNALQISAPNKQEAAMQAAGDL
jgi:hypothetical protein